MSHDDYSLIQLEECIDDTLHSAASPEEIAKIGFRPKSSADINRIKNLVSEEAFADIQDQAFEQIIKDSVQTGSTKLSDIFKPGNLERALRSYDDETLTAMFGPSPISNTNIFLFIPI